MQKQSNDAFLVEIVINSSSDGLDKVSVDAAGKRFATVDGAVNLVLVGNKDRHNKRPTHKDVVSLNTSMTMTGFCMSNGNARQNTAFYEDVAMSNLMGAWAFMLPAIEESWWVLPKDWDKIDFDVKNDIIGNYEKGAWANE